jgi:predicted Rossmann-fold nucleotide-binding protein
MGWLNKGCRATGTIDNVIGVIHEMWALDAGEDTAIANMITVTGDDLEERKRQLIQQGDCIMALPGGVGTFDELWDCVVCKSLKLKGMSTKPICLLNIDGYYTGMLTQMERALHDGLLYGAIHDYFYVAEDVTSALDWCESQVKKIDARLPDNAPSERCSVVNRKTMATMHMMAGFGIGLATGAAITAVILGHSRRR